MTAVERASRPRARRSGCLDLQTIVLWVNRYIKSLEGRFQLKASAGYLQLIAKNIEQVVHARENGNFCAAHSAQVPIELFWPLGITPLSYELYDTIAAIVGGDQQQSLPIPDDVGFPCRKCPCYRTVYGMVEVGAESFPDFVVHFDAPGDPTPEGHGLAATGIGLPSFGLNRPHGGHTPQSVAHWIREYESLIRFLEKQTGRRMNYDYLKEVVLLSYRATQLCMEIDELRGAVPCPLPANAAFAPAAVHGAWAGTQMCVDFLEQLRNELTERVAKGIAAVPQEKFRYMFATGLPFFEFGIAAEAEKRYGAVNVMDRRQGWHAAGEWLIDPDDPVASLARRAQSGTSNWRTGTATDPAEELRSAAARCRADGVVHFNCAGCRHAAGGYRVLHDTIGRSLGLPWLAIDCATLDRSSASLDDVMARLGDFFEAIEHGIAYRERHGRRGRQTRAKGKHRAVFP